MPNLKIGIKLMQLSGTFLMDIQGKTATKKCLCIPVEENKLRIVRNPIDGDEVYLNLFAFESNNEPKYHDYSLKRSLTEEEAKSMTPEQRRAMPFCGNVDIVKPQQQHQPNPQPQAGDPYPNTQPSQQYEGDFPF